MESQQVAELSELKGEILKMQTMLNQSFKGSCRDNIYKRDQKVPPQFRSSFAKTQTQLRIIDIQSQKLRNSGEEKRTKKGIAVMEGKESVGELDAGKVRVEREEAFLGVDF